MRLGIVYYIAFCLIQFFGKCILDENLKLVLVSCREFLFCKIHIKTIMHYKYQKMNTFKKLIPFSKSKPDEHVIPMTTNPVNPTQKTENKHVENNCHENIIIENNADFYLPLDPVPFRKITIVNLGEKSIRILSPNHCKLYHYFFCPTGSTQIILQKYNSFTMFYVKETWICK